MKNTRTNWTNPNTNFFAGMMSLRTALNSGLPARLVREYNENCEYPILKKFSTEKHNINLNDYKYHYGSLNTYNKILNDKNLNEIEKHLSLNYFNCFGKMEAVEHYYATGEVTADNLRGIGASHLIKVSDLISFLERNGEQKRADVFTEQYCNPETRDRQFFFDSFTEKTYDRNPKKFNHKLWVVEMLDKGSEIKVPFLIKILNVLLYPLKYVPQKSVLKMTEYTLYTFRVGSVMNGYSVQFQIPKKFSFRR